MPQHLKRVAVLHREILMLSLVHIGDKIDFNAVDFVEVDGIDRAVDKIDLTVDKL